MALRRCLSAPLIALVAMIALLGILVAGCGSGGDDGGNGNSAGNASDAANAHTIEDVAGREVSVPEQIERVILGEGRAVFATAVLNPDDPFQHVVGVGSDLHEAAPTFEEQVLEVAPHGSDIAVVGNFGKGDVTVENLLSLDPDVLVLTLDHRDTLADTGFLTQLDSVDIPYVFIDFRQDPIANTPKSAELLGKLFGAEERAADFAGYYENQVSQVTDRLAQLEDPAAEKPEVFLWRAAGMMDCCSTMKDVNLGNLLTVAGGRNMGDELLDTEFGQITPEKLISIQPEQIIVTGGAWATDNDQPTSYVPLGYNATQDKAEAGLAGLLETPGFSELTAPASGGFHAIYHQFYHSPYNFIALAQYAKWLHPELFADLDPEQIFVDFHQQWLPFAYSGTFFVTDTPAE